MTTKVKGSTAKKSARKDELVNAAVQAASVNNSLGVATSHDIRVLMDSGTAKVEDIELIDTLLNSAADDDVKVEDTKLYKKIVAAFTPARFDDAARTSELYTAIIARKGAAALTPQVIAAVDTQVASEKRVFNANNPAPAYSPALVIDWITNNAADEYRKYTGVAINKVVPANVRYYTNVFGVVSSAPLADGATLADVVRAILSEKSRVQAAKVALRREYSDNLHARKDTRTAARGAFLSGMSRERFIEYAATCYDWAVNEGSRLAASIEAAEIKLNAARLELYRLTDGVRGFVYESGELEGVWFMPDRLPSRGVSADVRKLWNDCRKRAKDLETARALL